MILRVMLVVMFLSFGTATNAEAPASVKKLAEAFDAYAMACSVKCDTEYSARIYQKRAEHFLSTFPGPYVFDVRTSPHKQMLITCTHVAEPSFFIWTLAQDGKILRHEIQMH